MCEKEQGKLKESVLLSLFVQIMLLMSNTFTLQHTPSLVQSLNFHCLCHFFMLY